jgi:hypothetical protein
MCSSSSQGKQDTGAAVQGSAVEGQDHFPQAVHVACEASSDLQIFKFLASQKVLRFLHVLIMSLMEAKRTFLTPQLMILTFPPSGII